MSFNAADMSPYGVAYAGNGVIFNQHHVLSKLIHQDHGMDQHKKQSLLTILNSPEAVDHLLAGAAGVALTHVITKYSDISPPARTLLSLAGFGIGNIIYNTLNQSRHTSFDPSTGTARINL
jgi:hypothetical protein